MLNRASPFPYLIHSLPKRNEDRACEVALNSFGKPAVALQQNIHFLAVGKSGDILGATAKVTNRSNHIGLIEFEVKNQEGLLLSIPQHSSISKKCDEELMSL